MKSQYEYKYPSVTIASISEIFNVSYVCIQQYLPMPHLGSCDCIGCRTGSMLASSMAQIPQASKHMTEIGICLGI